MKPKLFTSNNEELFAKLSKQAEDYLEENHTISITHNPAIATITVSLLEQLLKEANGHNLLVRKDEQGNIVFDKADINETLLELNPPGGHAE